MKLPAGVREAIGCRLSIRYTMDVASEVREPGAASCRRDLLTGISRDALEV
jgi:hypothetical protein